MLIATSAMPIADFKGVALGATAFTIALAWNEAVNATIRSIYPQNKKGANIAYAVVITLLVIFAYAVATHTAHYVKKAGKAAIAKFSPPVTQSRPIDSPLFIRKP